MQRRCLVGLLAVMGCSGSASTSSLTLTTLKDVDPDPKRVEVQLVAATGRTTYLPNKPAEIWGYRDGAVAGSVVSVPGPLLEARQGDHVVVHFRNDLPEATTIHWHGLRVPPGSDGTPAAQVPVPPGGTFEYGFDVPDTGTFWYHPHVAGDVQIERGLYAPLIVRGGVEPVVTADRMFVLDDVKLESDGKLSTQTNTLDLMLGRQGNVILANGVVGGTIESKAGARERWRFVNSANGRYFNLRLPGHTFQVIAWDGGVLPQPYSAETLVIAPGERYEVLVTLTAAVALETVHYDRGHNIPDPGPQQVFQVTLAGTAPVPAALPTSWGEALTLMAAPTAPVRDFVLSEDDVQPEDPKFMINGKMFPAPIEAVTSDVEVWSIKSDSEMDHPFHLHGMFFRVLDVDGVAPINDGWKDTVNVPQKKTLRFAVRYGEPGTWMYHCHILEHAERGMMGALVLKPR